MALDESKEESWILRDSILNNIYEFQTSCIWNRQGAGDEGVVKVIKDFYMHYNFSVLVLIEPQISGMVEDKVISSLNFDGSHGVEASGFSKGIWILWKEWV